MTRQAHGRSGDRTDAAYALKPLRLGIDTHQEPVVYMRRDCHICRAEGFESHSRLAVAIDERSVIATLHFVEGDLLPDGSVGLSEAAWRVLAPDGRALATFAHAAPVASMSAVRSKIYGHTLVGDQTGAILRDIVAGRYSDVELAAFVAACGGMRLDPDEIRDLTQAMIDVGERLRWDVPMVVDKHCVGGLPGNRTTPLVVAIVAAHGLTMPKTSSRAITSPAGTADTMETLAPVALSLSEMRRVVEREGGCVVWGGAMHLSPADDTLIRIERALDLDSEGQLVASVLSKKAAAGATHVVIDLPVGPSAKVRDDVSARSLAELLRRTGAAVGLTVRPVFSDGRQPVGRGIGPALEAHDLLAVFGNDPAAPADLRDRAVALAGEILELGGRAGPGEGAVLAARTLADGRAWRKFQAICEAQGGLREPTRAPMSHTVTGGRRGRVIAVDNRRLAKVAKLAGAPAAPAAGLYLETRLDAVIAADQPLFTVHAETRGELAYALDYVAANPGIYTVAES